jgi:hypothetical protein
MKVALAGMLALTATLVCCEACAAPSNMATTSSYMRLAQAERPLNLRPAMPGGPSTGSPPWMSPAERERTRRRIGINTSQEKKIEQLHADVFRQRRIISQKLRALSSEMRKMFDDYNYDRKKVAALSKQIVALHERRVKLFIENEEKMRNILTQQQFDRMRIMMKEEWGKRERMRGLEPQNPGDGRQRGGMRMHQPGTRTPGI